VAFRQILLRVMLWSLGIAAAVGAFAMLFFQEEMIWRVVATAVNTAVCAAAMLGFSVLSERDKSRTAGLLGVAFVAAEFLLILLLIWIVDAQLGLEGQILGTIGAVAAGAVPGMIMLRVRESPRAKVAATLGLILSGCELLMLLVTAWIFDPYWHIGHGVNDRLLESAGVLALLGPLAVGSLVGHGFDRQHWRLIGVGAAALAYAMALSGIWLDLRGGNAFTVVTTVAVYVTLANIVMLCPLKREQQWLRIGVLGCAALTAILLDLNIIYGLHGGSEMLVRLPGAFGIVTACGCLALAVLVMLNRRVQLKPIVADFKQFTLICPACQKKQTLPAGETCCGNCGLKIHTRFEEPRCATCGYLLYMLKSDRCPECGTAIDSGHGRGNPAPTRDISTAHDTAG